MRILSVEEMKAVEQAADAAGHSYAQMMDLAGQGVARAVLQRVSLKGRRVLILVGPGNNGGDGLVAARYLSDAGATVSVYLTRPRDVDQDPVFKRAKERGVTVVLAEEDAGGRELRRLVAGCHCLIDALLGTGVTPPLRGTLADVLEAAREELSQVCLADPLVSLNGPQERQALPRPFVVAVDGPSGMDFDTGEVASQALAAHLTVTFANPKSGQFKFPAAGLVGELVVADIGVPPDVIDFEEGLEVVTPVDVCTWLPSRPPQAHKGTFGRALIVAGSLDYTGAAALAAMSAVRTGAGLVTLAIPGIIHTAVISLVPEATVLPLPNLKGTLNRAAAPLVRERLEKYGALLLGPGLGRTDEARDFVKTFLGGGFEMRRAGFLADVPSEAALSMPPLVVDADGLNILSELSDWAELLPQETILTPHPGEMARLTQLETAEIQASRLEIARDYASRWGHIVVLKGAFSVVAAPDSRSMVLPFANAGLASAGTGDVLAGTIVSLLAQGLEPFEAAVTGAYVHGLAGEIARDKLGSAGMAAGDVAGALPDAVQRLTSR